MAFFSPHLFGISIAYSAALNFLDSTLTSNITHPLGMADFWVGPPLGQALIQTQERKPIRVFHSGNEWDLGTPESCIKSGNTTIPVTLRTPFSNFLKANNK